MKADIRNTFNPVDTNSPTFQYAEWRKYTDDSVTDNYQINCATKTKDAWIQSQSFCPSGYPYLSNVAADNLPGPNCIVISEFVNVKTYYLNN